jgi:hypothetical protein
MNVVRFGLKTHLAIFVAKANNVRVLRNVIVKQDSKLFRKDVSPRSLHKLVNGGQWRV